MRRRAARVPPEAGGRLTGVLATRIIAGTTLPRPIAMPVRSRVQQRRFEDAAQEAVVSLLVAAAHVTQQLEAVYAQRGITGDQYNVLRILRGAHPHGHPRFEIARRLIRRAPDVTRLLDRLARQGLVERAWDPDNRRHSIARITPRGLALLDSLDPEVRRVQREATAKLSASDLRTLARACDRLIP